jgi:hypothetical protein
MRAEFEALKSVLFDGNTFDTNGNDNWGEVDKLLTALGDKINEVEKMYSEEDMIAIVEKSRETGLTAEFLLLTEQFKMDVKHHDSILSGSRDVLIALDMEDTECIDNNWYDLFMENMELKPIAVRNIEYDFPQEVYTIGNADNTKIVADVYEDDYIKLCELGLIITESDEGFPNGSVANSLVRSDDFIAVVKSKQIDLSKVPTIPKQADDVAPTKQCSNTHTFDKVKEVIQILKTLDNGDCVDGETMEYILTQVGMEDQMLKQLFPLVNNDELDELLDIRNEYHSVMMSKKSV